jgi:hypothetical protein
MKVCLHNLSWTRLEISNALSCKASSVALDLSLSDIFMDSLCQTCCSIISTYLERDKDSAAANFHTHKYVLVNALLKR